MPFYPLEQFQIYYYWRREGRFGHSNCVASLRGRRGSGGGPRGRARGRSAVPGRRCGLHRRHRRLPTAQRRPCGSAFPLPRRVFVEFAAGIAGRQLPPREFALRAHPTVWRRPPCRTNSHPFRSPANGRATAGAANRKAGPAGP